MEQVAADDYLPLKAKIILLLLVVLLIFGYIVMSIGVGGMIGLYLTHEIPSTPCRHLVTWFMLLSGYAVCSLSRYIYSRVCWVK